jgi:hypothetical protein
VISDALKKIQSLYVFVKRCVEHNNKSTLLVKRESFDNETPELSSVAPCAHMLLLERM